MVTSVTLASGDQAAKIRKRGRATGARQDASPGAKEQIDTKPPEVPALPNFTTDHQLENAIRAKVRQAFSDVRARYGVSQETALKAAAAGVVAELKMVVDDEVKDIAEPWKPVGRLPGM